jgi:hypothetical protein
MADGMTAGTGMTGHGILGTGIHLGIMADIILMVDGMIIHTAITEVGTVTIGAATEAGTQTTTGPHTSVHAVPLQSQEEMGWVQGLHPIAEPMEVTEQGLAAALPELAEKSAGQLLKART